MNAKNKNSLNVIINNAINNNEIQMLLNLYNRTVYFDNKEYGFLVNACELGDIINELLQNSKEDFLFTFDSKLKLCNCDYVWTDGNHVIRGGKLSDVCRLFTDDDFIESIINEVISTLKHNSSILYDYFDYNPLQEWLNNRIQEWKTVENWKSIINNGDIVVLQNGIACMYTDEMLIDSNAVSDIVSEKSHILWKKKHFTSDGTNIINNDYSIKHIIDIVSRKVKWHMPIM